MPEDRKSNDRESAAEAYYNDFYAACARMDAAGASFRMVCDVGNWDASVCINAPGQSGDPRSAHYDDLAPKWAAGEYVPLPFSREAVDAAAELVIRSKQELEERAADQANRRCDGEIHAVDRAAGVRLRIPLQKGARSLNVALAASMVLSEALRQTQGFAQLS